MAAIKDSVGNAAANAQDDVRYVKSLVLAISDTYNVAPTVQERKQIDAKSGVCEPALTTYLARFQRMAVASEAPSGGRVMPKGSTIKKLEEYAKASQQQTRDAVIKSASAASLEKLDVNPKGPEILILHDLRLQGWKPKGNNILSVNSKTPITSAIAWVVSKAREFNFNVYVKIMAHGYETWTGKKKVVDEEKIPWKDTLSLHPPKPPMKEVDTYSDGGSGIMFCAQDITLSTLPLFASWKGTISKVDLLACGAAYVTPGCEGKDGDGNILCSRFAKTIGAPIRASTAAQLYHPNGKANEHALDFGAWEGIVKTYDSNGNVVNVQLEPGK